jgi:N-methylhydantoinase A
MSFSRQMTIGMKSTSWNQAALGRVVDAQVEDLSKALVEAGHERGALSVSMTAGVRYSGQSYETEIADPALHDRCLLDRQFDRAHHALYGYSTGEAWELASLRIEVSAPEDRADVRGVAAPFAGEPRRLGVRNVTFEDGETHAVDVLDRATLPVGRAFVGPLVVEDAWSTVILPPRDRLTADASGNLLMEVAS